MQLQINTTLEIRAGMLHASHLLKTVEVRGVTGTLQEVSYRKSLLKDEAEVWLFITGEGWKTHMSVDPETVVKVLS